MVSAVRYGENSKRAEPVALPLSVIGLRFLIRYRGYHYAFTRRFRFGAGRFINFARMLASFRRISDDGRSCRSRLSRSGIHCAGSWRQFFANGLFDNTRTGKADNAFGSAMLRSPSMAKLAETRPSSGRSARRCTASRAPAFLQCRRGFRHLHQRHQCFLHTWPPEAEKQISGQLSSSACSTDARNVHPQQTPLNRP